MAQAFGGSYWHAMDKDSLVKYSADIKEIGVSHGVGDSLQGLRANIFTGAPIVELGFSGAGKGQRGQRPTPESYGKDEREAMRQLAKVNDVRITTHSSFNAPPLSGFGEGGFNKDIAANSIQEIKKSIDFAADVAGGGPIVVHTGEWQRPVLKENVFGKEKFQAYENEPETVQLANMETGQVQALKSDIKITIPKPLKPGLNPWENPQRNQKGDIIFEEKPLTLKEIAERQKTEDGKSKTLAQVYVDFMQNQLSLAKGEADRYRSEARSLRERGELPKKQYEEVQRLVQEGNVRNADFIARRFLDEHGLAPPPNTSKFKTYLQEGGAIEHLREMNNDLEEHTKGFEGISLAQEAKYLQLKHEVDTGVTKPIEEVGLKRTANSIAIAAMYAYAKEKKQNLKDPIFIAPENVFAETYGSRPDEIRNIITASRAAMVEKLKSNMPEEEARKVAEEHIKATIDIGHAYTWRKYFTGSDADFKKWLMDEMKQLAKEGIIGHVHLTDNLGYDDEHLTIGEGNVPVREFIDEIKKEGYKGVMIAEVGGQPEGKLHEAMLGAWRSLNSPVYRVDPGGTGLGWNDVSSYSFGRTTNPFSILGEYAPSEEFKGSPFYSGLGLE